MFIVYLVFSVFIQLIFVGGECDVVTKKQWDGLEPVHVEYLPRPVDLVVIGHTVTQACNTDAACVDIMRSIQEYMMDTLHYWDIGYNFVIGGNGKVYEGTGWLRVGAHTYGINRRSIGIAFIGNFENDQPTKASLDAVKALLECGVKTGHLKADYHVVGQKQIISSKSPGRKLYTEIRSWPQWLENTSSIE